MTARKYCGWHRTAPGFVWVKVTEADSPTACLDRLLECTRGGDKMVLADGKDPNLPALPVVRPVRRRPGG
jgi:hypothetical protein